MNFTDKQKNIAVFLLYTAFAGVIVLLLFALGRYIVPLISPFIAAWVVALLLQPAINFLDEHTKIPRGVSTLILILLVSGLICFVGFISAKELMSELSALADRITVFIEGLRNDDGKVLELIDKINSIVPVFDVSNVLIDYWENFDENIIDLFQTVATNISSGIVPFLKGTVTFVADFFVVAIIFIIAIYYIAVDFKKINYFILAQLSETPRKYVTMIKRQFLSTTWKYIKAYSVIIVITFSELLIAFTVLGVNYPYLVALITALVDILPIIGTGAILVPWGIFLALSGDVFTGVGLLATYVIVTVVRQIIEPKIVGSYIGMYPLVTLIMMYAGLKAFGIIGLFAFPIISIIIKNLNDSGTITLWKYPEGVDDGNAPQKSKFSAIKDRISYKGNGGKESSKDDSKNSSDDK